jgi:hypothetical protein
VGRVVPDGFKLFQVFRPDLVRDQEVGGSNPLAPTNINGTESKRYGAGLERGSGRSCAQCFAACFAASALSWALGRRSRQRAAKGAPPVDEPAKPSWWAKFGRWAGGVSLTTLLLAFGGYWFSSASYDARRAPTWSTRRMSLLVPTS